MSKCLNCDAILEGMYCKNCGQKAKTERLSFRRIFADFIDAFFSMESVALRTVSALCLRPGRVAREYVEGKRIAYLSPFRYFLLAVAINIASSLFLGRPAVNPVHHSAENTAWSQNLMSLQISLVCGLFMLLLAFVLLKLHKKAGYNLAENYVLLLYVLGQTILVMVGVQMVAAGLGNMLEGSREGLASGLVFTVYLLWAGWQFYQEAFWKLFLKVAATYGFVALFFGSAGALVALVMRP
ncbi:MAG: DUF3667 domain-containing protein [Calditrichaeota bacterium]|nr:MAG: DUF3667 domain-containing protein [Calditrichota bacterium]